MICLNLLICLNVLIDIRDFVSLTRTYNQISSFSQETNNEAAKARSRATGATANTRPCRANRTDVEAIGKFGLTSG